MEITPNKPITEETLHIVKDSFEEAKGIKVLSLYVEDGIIYGIYRKDNYSKLIEIHI